MGEGRKKTLLSFYRVGTRQPTKKLVAILDLVGIKKPKTRFSTLKAKRKKKKKPSDYPAWKTSTDRPTWTFRVQSKNQRRFFFSFFFLLATHTRKYRSIVRQQCCNFSFSCKNCFSPLTKVGKRKSLRVIYVLKGTMEVSALKSLSADWDIELQRVEMVEHDCNFPVVRLYTSVGSYLYPIFVQFKAKGRPTDDFFVTSKTLESFPWRLRLNETWHLPNLFSNFQVRRLTDFPFKREPTAWVSGWDVDFSISGIKSPIKNGHEVHPIKTDRLILGSVGDH